MKGAMRIIGLISLAAALVLLSGCLQPPQIPQLSNAKVGKIVKEMENPPKFEELKQKLVHAPKIRFKPLSRDPFVPPAVLKQKGLHEIKTEEELAEEAGGLEEPSKQAQRESKEEKALIEAVQQKTFTITGLLQDSEGNYSAIFGLPDGKTYIITEGMVFGNYRVVKITRKKIIIMKGNTKIEIPVPKV